MSFSVPSQVSATTGSDHGWNIFPCFTDHAIAASRTTPTLCVLVMKTGPSMKPAFLDPGRAGHLAVAVLREPAGEHRIVRRLAARKDHGHAGPHRTLAHLERALTANDRGHADLDAAHVGDGVERTRRAVERDAEVARARFVLGDRQSWLRARMASSAASSLMPRMIAEASVAQGQVRIS